MRKDFVSVFLLHVSVVMLQSRGVQTWRRAGHSPAGQNETDHRPVTDQHATTQHLRNQFPVSPSDQEGEIWDRPSHGSDLHTLMKRAIIGQNWFLFPLWLSCNWVWSSSRGELIDLWLNSSLFSLENNYVVMQWLDVPSCWPPPPSVCYERNHFCCHLQSVPNDSLCFTEWGGAVTWKMSSSEVHEGVKLQTPLCPRPRASKGISSFIDRAAEFQADGGGGGCCCRPTTSSSNPDCFCFQVTSYLLLQLFQFLRACCMKTEGSVGNVHKPPQRDNTKETHWNLLTFTLSGRRKPCQRHTTSSNE